MESLYERYKELHALEKKEFTDVLKKLPGSMFLFDSEQDDVCVCAKIEHPFDFNVKSVDMNGVMLGYDVESGEQMRVYYDDVVISELMVITEALRKQLNIT